MPRVDRRNLALLGLGSAALLGGNAARSALPQKNFRTGTLEWAPSVERARERAQSERKPLLVLSLFGRLDEGFC